MIKKASQINLDPFVLNVIFKQIKTPNVASKPAK
jgi:hypothetical protein